MPHAVDERTGRLPSTGNSGDARYKSDGVVALWAATACSQECPECRFPNVTLDKGPDAPIPLRRRVISNEIAISCGHHLLKKVGRHETWALTNATLLEVEFSEIVSM